MKFDVLTLFPNMFEQVIGDSIVGRARTNNFLEINLINIRDFSTNKHRKVDDYPYGGGTGMVMSAQPIHDAWHSTFSDQKPFTIYLTPQGKTLTQKLAHQISQKDHVVLLCGHYEGVDERIIDEIVDLEVSIGDYVLTGGEIPAMVLLDCVSRLVPGVLSSEEAFTNESHANGLLEYPQYTRPENYCGRNVPEILLSGHHTNIEKWRLEKSMERTKNKRPDLLV
ncbi:MAG: tRNA (guanosine(37)-N1)-methyltransferase TrmD [Bacillota bacterium]